MPSLATPFTWRLAIFFGVAYLLAYEALELSLGVVLNSVGFVVIIPVGLEVWEAMAVLSALWASI